jgi:hypothetical protein
VISLIIAAAEPSKVPFYIAGGLLVVWALALAAMGLTRPAFPNGERGARVVMLGTFVLMIAAMATAVLTSAFPK